MVRSSVTFKIPNSLNAVSPAERRGLRRDYVRLMVLNKNTGDVIHDRFNHIVDYFNSGDVLVLNNSRTIPAILSAFSHLHLAPMEIRLARHIEDAVWDVLPVGELQTGELLKFSNDLTAKVDRAVSGSPFYRIRFSLDGLALWNEIFKIGEPVRYEYIQEPWPLAAYQTVYATVPGSVEMPSAGRAFSWELLIALRKKGVDIAYLQLHTGLSYLLDDQWHLGPQGNPEAYSIPEATIHSIQNAKKCGKRVIAAGTTVVRALESGASNIEGYGITGITTLHIDKNFSLRVVDGLLTGFHEPEASHLDLLSAFIDEEKLEHAYHIALEERYLWHEFGDMNLIL